MYIHVQFVCKIIWDSCKYLVDCIDNSPQFTLFKVIKAQYILLVKKSESQKIYIIYIFISP